MVPPCGVLLDDEDPRADSADRELLVALDGDALYSDTGDFGQPWSVAQEGHELIERRLGPLGVNLHGALLTIAHPAHHPELTRAPERGVAKADALHLTAHRNTDRHNYRLACVLNHSASAAHYGLCSTDHREWNSTRAGRRFELSRRRARR